MVGSGDEKILLALYVDDLFIAWRINESLEEVKKRLNEHFRMKDFGRLLFRVDIGRRLEGCFYLVEEKYATKVVAKFWMGDAIDAFRAGEPS